MQRLSYIAATGVLGFGVIGSAMAQTPGTSTTSDKVPGAWLKVNNAPVVAATTSAPARLRAISNVASDGAAPARSGSAALMNKVSMTVSGTPVVRVRAIVDHASSATARSGSAAAVTVVPAPATNTPAPQLRAISQVPTGAASFAPQHLRAVQIPSSVAPATKSYAAMMVSAAPTKDSGATPLAIAAKPYRALRTAAVAPVMEFPKARAWRAIKRR